MFERVSLSYEVYVLRCHLVCSDMFSIAPSVYVCVCMCVCVCVYMSVCVCVCVFSVAAGPAEVLSTDQRDAQSGGVQRGSSHRL